MKKILFGTLVFSLILSSLAYAEADDVMTMKDMLEAEEEAKIREKYLEGPVVSESTNENKTKTTATNMTSEEEREAYAALERARARIEKEEQEKLKAQQEITEAQNQMENQAEVVTEQGANENLFLSSRREVNKLYARVQDKGSPCTFYPERPNESSFPML